MEYAILGSTGLKVSRLGFGCMRLPMASSSEVDRELAIPMLRRAFELGITYFDTAVGYCGSDSQRALGEAMEGIRDQVVLSTKNHHYNKNDVKGWWKMLEDSLEFLRTDYIDIYNVHGLNFEAYESSFAGDDGLYKQLAKAKEQGLIRHICHSFHGTPESLQKMVDTGLFESVTCQYNLLDRSNEEAIAYAHEHNRGVVIMGPVGGGRLGFPSDKASELVGEVKSTPELALRFVLSNPNVTVALSGMENLQMLEENVATVSRSGDLSAADHEQIEAAILERKEFLGLYCTGCGYCMPCPEGVDIPANFEIVNLERIFGLTDHAKGRYASLEGKAALCRLCGKCVEPCPQNLDIPARLAEAVAGLDARAGNVTGWSEVRGASTGEQGMLNLDLRYHLKNFTDQEQQVAVEFQTHAEDQIEPARFEVEKLRAYGRRHTDVSVLVRPPLEALSLDAVLSFDGARSLEHLHHIVAAAPAAAGYNLDPAARRPGTLHVPSAMHPIRYADGGSRGKSFDFAVSHDDECLYAYVDVEGDAATDAVCIYLDGRKPVRLGKGRYEDGVMNVTISPGEGDAEPEVKASNSARVDAKVERTEFGYRVDCAIPWEVFSQVEGKPSTIGLDLALISRDADGKESLRLSWTGRARQEKDPGAFGRLVIV